MNIKELLIKYRPLILYAVFGVLTTIVNVVVYWFVAHVFQLGTTPSTVIAWIVAVLFAYITNRIWVFESEASKTAEIIREIISFFACRVATGIVDIFCMFLFVEVLKFNDIIVKLLANIIVILLNYIASKLIIFKHKN